MACEKGASGWPLTVYRAKKQRCLGRGSGNKKKREGKGEGEKKERGAKRADGRGELRKGKGRVGIIQSGPNEREGGATEPSAGRVPFPRVREWACLLRVPALPANLPTRAPPRTSGVRKDEPPALYCHREHPLTLHIHFAIH